MNISEWNDSNLASLFPRLYVLSRHTLAQFEDITKTSPLEYDKTQHSPNENHGAIHMMTQKK